MGLRRPKRNKWELRALAKLRQQQEAAKAQPSSKPLSTKVSDHD